MHPIAFLLAVAIAVVVVTVTLDAYERFPSPGEHGSDVASVQAAAAGLRGDTPRRMQINHAIVRMLNPKDALDFYTRYTGNAGVARAILDAALRQEVPVNLAFALGWQESRFDGRAVSGSNSFGTRDWGLFQLNDGPRPNWKRDDFFDVSRNAEHAMRYLRLCLSEMGSVEMALAAYNAGIRGVREWGVFPSTRAYASAIIAYERDLDRTFGERF
jgi:soluble lytic murein transglycosylase-like protein